MKFICNFVSILTLLSTPLACYAAQAGEGMPCPPMEIIKNQSANVSYAAETAPTNYTVNLNSSFMYMKEKWRLLTLVVATSKDEALEKAKQNITSTYHQYDLETKLVDGNYECGYIGKHGSIFVFVQPADWGKLG